MSMYEARQNKEKVSRKIDELREKHKQRYLLKDNRNNSIVPIQRVNLPWIIIGGALIGGGALSFLIKRCMDNKNNKKKAQIDTMARDEIKAVYSSSISYENVKENGANKPAKIGHFIINVDGTRHHIYPRCKLSNYVINISRTLNTYHKVLEKPSVKENEVLKNKIEEESNKIKMLEHCFGIKLNEKGECIGNKNSLYWTESLFFCGVNSSYRSDDPKDSEEKKCPRTGEHGEYEERFNRAIQFGRKMKEMSDDLELLGSKGYVDINKIESAKDAYSEMITKGSSRWITSKEKDEDWKVTSGNWGEMGSMYALA